MRSLPTAAQQARLFKTANGPTSRVRCEGGQSSGIRSAVWEAKTAELPKRWKSPVHLLDTLRVLNARSEILKNDLSYTLAFIVSRWRRWWCVRSWQTTE